MLGRLLPPPQWRLPVLIAAGIFTGLGVFSIYLGKENRDKMLPRQATRRCAVWYAQCHVEYYFNKKKVEYASYLTFPGITVLQWKPWKHTMTGLIFQIGRTHGAKPRC